jgi:hypothetical protein
MTNVMLHAVDAIELAEILEYFVERLDILADHDLAKLLFADCSTYGLDDLRTLSRILWELRWRSPA